MGDPSTTKLTPELTRHIARLSHLDISKAEAEEFTGQLNTILDQFAQLNEVDVEFVEPTRHAMELTNVFRPDEPKPGLSQEDALKNAPEEEAGYIKAPRIV